jgi:hypothetical protein
MELPELRVYRNGSWQTVTTPAQGDSFSLESKSEVAVYSIFRTGPLNSATIMRIHSYVKSENSHKKLS